jgi:hypothetical protein
MVPVMAYAYTYDAEDNLLVIRFWGAIPFDEETEAVEATLSDPQLQPDLRILADRSDAVVTSTPEQMRRHIDVVGKHVERLGTPKVANVVSADFDFGMVRMYEMMADDELTHQFRVFRDLEEACEWLGVEMTAISWPTAKEIIHEA